MLLARFDVTDRELNNLSHRAQGFPAVLTRYEDALQNALDGKVTFGDSQVIMGRAVAARMVDVRSLNPLADPVLCGEIEPDIYNPNGLWLCDEEPDDFKELPIIGA